VPCAGDVGCAIHELASGVVQVNLVDIQLQTSPGINV
jgi:hypothetical protein